MVLLFLSMSPKCGGWYVHCLLWVFLTLSPRHEFSRAQKCRNSHLGLMRTGQGHPWGILLSALASLGWLSFCFPPMPASDKHGRCMSCEHDEHILAPSIDVRKACSACSSKETGLPALPLLFAVFFRIAGLYLQNVLTCKEGVAAG